ncbi:MAG: PQQ-binding-like beta-propeller repeat protein [Phycisphaerae bacterium]
MIQLRVMWTACVLGGAALVAPVRGGTAQWGGPKQDFKVKTSGLAERWPADGPPRLWSRDLGEGYSAILHDAGRLYTMYRRGEQDVAVAIDARTGKTLWEYAYDSPAHEKHVKVFNSGPRATPLLTGGRLYTIGCSGRMHCLDAKTGKVRWSHDLWKEYEATFLPHGYASSPFAYGKTIIVMVGGKGHAFVAFDQKSGAVIWEKQDFQNSYSTPKLVRVDGEPQLLCFMAKELAAINPASGELLWTYSISNQWNQNISLPILGKDNRLFISVAQAGSRGLKLTRKGKKTKVEETWSNRKVRIHHNNAIRVGDYVYASSGGMGRPGLFWAVNYKTGEVAWRQRGFAKANSLYADGQFIILDEDGELGIATATPELFEIHSRAHVLEPKGQSRTWTVPTLVGTTLYLRDSVKIMALDLGVHTALGPHNAPPVALGMRR